MKKVLALALAVAMVLSMASVIFAATTTELVYAIDSIVPYYWKVQSKEVYLQVSGGSTVALPDATVAGANRGVAYGNVIYYPLIGKVYDKKNGFAEQTANKLNDALVTKYDAVKGVKITQDWDMGNDWVSSVSLVKKKLGPSGDYYYFLAVSIKSAPVRNESADVAGELTLKKTSGDNKINRYDVLDCKAGELPPFEVAFEVKYSAQNTATKGLSITDSSTTFEFDTTKYDDATVKPNGLYQEDEETEFEFDKWEGATFTVNTYGQGKIVLKATTDYNSDVGAMYPDANLDFYNGNGSGFNKTGTMFIPAEEGSYIYELKNGVLVAIPSAEYDDYDEGYYFRTRTLGVYVVSDAELDLAAAPSVSTPGDGGISVVEPGDAPTIPVNPGTGAAA